MSAWFEVFGRLHPLLLHLPIGCVAVLVVLEALALAKRIERPRAALAAVAGLGALTAIAAITTGLVLARGTDYDADATADHRNVAIAFGVLLLLAFAAYARSGSAALQRALLAACALLIVPAGHMGNTITRGADFLTAPLAGRAAATPRAAQGEPTAVDTPKAETPEPSTYAAEIAPFFAARCTSCHGEVKKKGKLQLHTHEAVLKGGESGPVLVAGDVAGSEIARRLRLPIDDDDHMPPEGKTQPTAQQIARVEAWIDAGAKPDGVVPRPTGAGANGAAVSIVGAPAGVRDTAAHAGEVAPGGKGAKPAGEPPQEAIDALKARLVHVQKLAGDSSLLWIDFAAPAKDIDDAEAQKLLAPLADFVGELSLARTMCGDDVIEVLARCAHLTRLDLRATALTDAGLARLARHATLESLVVAQTKLTDAALATIESLPALKVLHAWNSGLSPEALAKLRADRPDLRLEAGDTPAAAALETEAEPKLTNSAPVPGAPATAAAELKPVNATCPVTGAAVNAKYTIVHKGKVIGFCCPNCPKTFWEDPAKFESKLP